MTAKEARRIINKANSRIYRLQQGEFGGDTPATKALRERMKRQGLALTKKGYISIKGLTDREIQKAGTQAQYFMASVTSTTRGTRQDIARRTNTFMTKTGLDAQSVDKLYQIFDTKTYKRLKEIAGSENVIATASRKLLEKPNINIKDWLYRQELALRKGTKTVEDILNIDDINEAEITGELF